MKFLNLSAGVLVVLSLFSCEQIKEWVSVEVETDVTMAVNLGTVDVVEIKSAEAKGASLTSESTDDKVYYFEGITSIDLSSNQDVKDYLDGIIKFKVSDASFTLSGNLTTGNITSLNMEYSFDASDFDDEVTEGNKYLGIPLYYALDNDKYDAQLNLLATTFDVELDEITAILSNSSEASKAGAKMQNIGSIDDLGDLEKYEAHLKTIENLYKAAMAKMTNAQNSGDLMTALCADDKLKSITTAMSAYKDRLDMLRDAIQSVDSDRMKMPQIVMNVLLDRANTLAGELNACVSEQFSFIGESEVNFTTTSPLNNPQANNVNVPELVPTPSLPGTGEFVTEPSGMDAVSVQDFIDLLKNNGYPPVYIKVSGTADFDATTTGLQLQATFPSAVRYTPL